MAEGVDARVFAAEAAELHQRLTRLCLAMSGDRGLAEECAQEALVRAWERVDRGEPLASLAAWTTTVALNQCRSRLRRRVTERRSLVRMAGRAEAAGLVHEPGGSELSTEVRAAVLALPRRQREVVVLHYLLDEDTPTIAGICGISEGAVRNALFHARATLAEVLGPHLDDQPERGEPGGGTMLSRRTAPSGPALDERRSDG